jgi:uncharacterized membrane protein
MTGSPESHHPKPARLGLGVRLRTYFLAGILISAPVGLTIYLAWLFISWVDETVFGVIPVKYNPETYLPFSIPGIGLIIIVVALTLLGALTAGFLGRLAQQLMEAILNRLPIVRTIYNAIKQVIETVLANQSVAFRECVLVEYPRKGVWAIGFITGTTTAEIQGATNPDVVNVFVPTAPNPTSGFLLFVPRSEVTSLKMSVEDGIKMVISSGIVAPPEPKATPAKASR